MTPDEYRRQGLRAEPGHRRHKSITMAPASPEMRLVFGALGLQMDSKPLIGHMKEFMYYGKPIDNKVVEEGIGDLLWCLNVMADAIGKDLGEIMDSNFQRIVEAFPDKYPDYIATTDGYVARCED